MRLPCPDLPIPWAPSGSKAHSPEEDKQRPSCSQSLPLEEEDAESSSCPVRMGDGCQGTGRSNAGLALCEGEDGSELVRRTRLCYFMPGTFQRAVIWSHFMHFSC